MIPRLSRFALCGCLAASLGCQNPTQQTNRIADRDSYSARLSFASDDLAGLETGRGHMPSLASEMADYRRQAEEERTGGIPGGSQLTLQRLLERGHDADAHGRTQEARMYYEQVLAEDPEQPDAHHRLAILADRAGDFPRAEQHYRLALLGKPHDADVLNDLGYSYFLQGRAADSERYLSQARQIDPRHPHVSENLSLLYDPAKAEQVLLNVMGPRQTQATLAQLFQGSPSQMLNHPEPMPSIERGGAILADQRMRPLAEETPVSMQSLQQKMEEARLRSIADRHKRVSPAQEAGLSNRSPGLPPVPLNHPPHIPSRAALETAEVPDGRLNDAFRSIDGQSRALQSTTPSYAQRSMAPSTRPPAYETRRVADDREFAAADARYLTEQRASAPQWNAPPQSWPAYAPPGNSQGAIEQTNHTPAPLNSSRRELPSAARRAAEIGMAAGPGSIFPPMREEYDVPQSQPAPSPAARSLPGTDSRVNGAIYSQPGGHGVPTYWHDAEPAQDPNGAWGQAPAGWNDQANQTGREDSREGYGNDPYDQMRAQQNAQFNHDQQAFAAQPGLLSNGPPGREDLPTSFDPQRQDWPAYTREEYDTRQMDQPPTPSQPQFGGHGRYGGQTVPQFNHSTQQPPQNYGGRW